MESTKYLTKVEVSTSNERVSDVIRMMGIGESYKRPLKKIHSTRCLIYNIKDEPEHADKVFKTVRDRENKQCIVTRKK